MTNFLQIGATLLALVSVPAILLLGPRIQTSLGRKPHAWPFLAGWAGMILLVDVPIGHSSNCGMAPSGETLLLVGIWWIPYAAYSFAILACSARLVGRKAVRHPLLLIAGSLAACSLAIFLERAAGDSSRMRWWSVHLALQFTLGVLGWMAFAPRVRFAPLLLLLFSAALPFLPLSFWHACVRIRRGDSLQEVARKLEGYYWIPPSSQASDRIRLGTGRPIHASSEGRIWFAATDGVHADTCDLLLVEGHVEQMRMLPD